MTDIFITVEGKHIKVGDYHAEAKTFTKHVKKSKHLHNKSDSWGIDAQVWKDCINDWCEELIIIDEEEKKVYTISIKKANDKGRLMTFNPHRTQLFIPRSEFDVGPQKYFREDDYLQSYLQSYTHKPEFETGRKYIQEALFKLKEKH